MKKVIIHYPFIPHYRNPIFNILHASKKYEFKFMADTSANFDGILQIKDSMDFSPLESKYKTLKIPFFNKKIEIELGVINHLIREKGDIYVCLGNPNIITSWIYSLVAKALKYKVYYWTQGLKVREGGLKGWLRRLYLRIPDGLLLYGDRANEILKKDHIENNVVIYNSLNYYEQKMFRENIKQEDVITFREKYGIKENDIVLVSIGRLLPKLKIEQAIEAVISSNDKFDYAIHLLIVGAGPDEERLKSISKNNEDIIHFMGPVYSEDKLSLIYASSSLSIVCGVVGLAAMHSLAYGVPMITHGNYSCHCPEVEAIIDGKTGFIYKENNIGDIQNSIKRYSLSDRMCLRNHCITMIESKYNPISQAGFIEDALSNA